MSEGARTVLSVEVHWERLDPGTVERMIVVLLSLGNPEVQRIDGRGGDGGRDAQFRGPAGVDFYEIKSFADRVDGRRGRRAGVERSLARAKSKSPASWTLVVPVDPTEEEEAWFEGLREDCSFRLRWWGLNWLSGQLAKHPEVARYYVQDQRDELLALMSEHNALAADAADVDAILARMTPMKDRMRLLDPHMFLELTTLPLSTAVEAFPDALMYAQRATAIGPVTVAVRPRYAGAARDSELPRMSVQLRFPDNEEGRAAAQVWEGVHGWGEAGDIAPDFVEVLEHVAPAGLGGDVGPAGLTFSPRTPLPVPPSGRLVCRLDGRQVASVPVAVDHIGSGEIGVSIAGADSTGGLTFRCRLGPPVVSMTLTHRPASGLLPSQLLPPLRLLASAREGAEMELVLTDEPKAIPFGALSDPAEARADHEYLEFIEALAVVQDRCAAPFPVPELVTGSEVEQVKRLARLLQQGLVDEPATSGFTLTLVPGAPRLDRDGFLLVQTDSPEHLLGQELDVGMRHTLVGPCRVETSASPTGPPGTTRVVVIPESEAREVTRLGALPPPLDDDSRPPLLELQGNR